MGVGGCPKMGVACRVVGWGGKSSADMVAMRCGWSGWCWGGNGVGMWWWECGVDRVGMRSELPGMGFVGIWWYYAVGLRYT